MARLRLRGPKLNKNKVSIHSEYSQHEGEWINKFIVVIRVPRNVLEDLDSGVSDVNPDNLSELDEELDSMLEGKEGDTIGHVRKRKSVIKDSDDNIEEPEGSSEDQQPSPKPVQVTRSEELQEGFKRIPINIIPFLKREVGDDDDMGSVERFTFSLQDPLTQTRIHIPVKSSYCVHIECFDFDSFCMFNNLLPGHKTLLLRNLLRKNVDSLKQEKKRKEFEGTKKNDESKHKGKAATMSNTVENPKNRRSIADQSHNQANMGIHHKYATNYNPNHIQMFNAPNPSFIDPNFNMYSYAHPKQSPAFPHLSNHLQKEHQNVRNNGFPAFGPQMYQFLFSGQETVRKYTGNPGVQFVNRPRINVLDKPNPSITHYRCPICDKKFQSSELSISQVYNYFLKSVPKKVEKVQVLNLNQYKVVEQVEKKVEAEVIDLSDESEGEYDTKVKSESKGTGVKTEVQKESKDSEEETFIEYFDDDLEQELLMLDTLNKSSDARGSGSWDDPLVLD